MRLPLRFDAILADALDAYYGYIKHLLQAKIALWDAGYNSGTFTAKMRRLRC